MKHMNNFKMLLTRVSFHDKVVNTNKDKYQTQESSSPQKKKVHLQMQRCCTNVSVKLPEKLFIHLPKILILSCKKRGQPIRDAIVFIYIYCIYIYLTHNKIS